MSAMGCMNRILRTQMAHQIFSPSRPFPLMHLAKRTQTRALMQTLAPGSQTMPIILPLPSGSLRSRVLDLVNKSRIRFATHRDGRSDSFASRLRAARQGMPPPRPPRHRSGLAEWLDNNVPDNALIWGLVGLNVLVFIGWKMAVAADATDRRSKQIQMMMQNFTVNWTNMTQRPWTLITSFFSHMDFWHLGFNMFTFYFLAPNVLYILRPARFLTLYFGAGVVSNVVSAFSNKIYSKRDTPSLGASAAVYGVVSYLACHAPRMPFQLYGIIPIPAWICVSGIFAYDLYSSMNGLQPGTNTMGHVVGMMSGVVYFVARRMARF